MSVQLILLKSGETVIADAKEMVSGSDENQKPCGYIFTEPFVIFTQAPSLLLNEEPSYKESSSKQTEVNVTLTPWIPLTEDRDVLIPLEWVVTMVNPISMLKEMYEERSNGEKNDKMSSIKG